MAYVVSQKAISAARQMKEDLTIRGLTVVDKFDDNGNPYLEIGTMAAGSQSATVRLKMESTVQVDGLGLAQRVFTPHVAQIILEESTISGVSLLTVPNLAKILREVEKHGTKVEIWTVANTNAPILSKLSGGTLVATLDNIWHPLTSTM